jgi:hypothetical protein
LQERQRASLLDDPFKIWQHGEPDAALDEALGAPTESTKVTCKL